MRTPKNSEPERKLVIRDSVIPPIETESVKHYQQHFADVLNCARVIRDYLGGKPEFSQPTLYSTAIQWACRVINVQVHHATNGRNYWRLRKNSDSFIRAAGLDTETLEIVDLDRAKACWMQLVESWVFRPERQAQNLERVRRGEKTVSNSKLEPRSPPKFSGEE